MNSSACCCVGSSTPPADPPIPRPDRAGGDDTNTAPGPATTAAKRQPFHDRKIYGWSIRRSPRLQPGEQSPKASTSAADQMQHIRARLGAGTRDVATLRALREGLYVPASFLDERD